MKQTSERSVTSFPEVTWLIWVQATCYVSRLVQNTGLIKPAGLCGGNRLGVDSDRLVVALG